MTALSLVDGQYRFDATNGLSKVMGAQTPIRVLNVTGLRALGPISSADIKRTGQHGTLRAGKRTYGKRTIQFDLALEGQTYADVENLLDDFLAAFQDSDDPGVLVFKRRSKEERRVECTVGRAEFVSDYDSWVGLAKGSIELQCNDPLVYSSRLDSETLVPPISTGFGRTYNLTYNRVYGGVQPPPFVTVENRGNVDTSLIWTVYGPVQNPGFKRIDTGEAVKLDITIADGDVLEVDFDLHTILLNGSSRRNVLDPSSTWWKIPPGKTQLYLLGQGLGSDASSTLQFRSAWVSA